MQHHPAYQEDTQKQSKKRRRLNESSPSPTTIDTQCLFCNIAIERSSREEFLDHMEQCLTRLTEGNQIRRNKHRSGAFSKMTTCPACNEDSPFDFKSMRDKARHLKQCLVSNGTTLSNVMDARDIGHAQSTTPIDLSSPSPPPLSIHQGNNNIDLTIIDDDDDPFSSQPRLEDFDVANNKRRDSLLSDESPSPSYTHADSIIDNSQLDNIDLTLLDDSPLVDIWSQRQGSVNGDMIEEDEAGDNNNPSLSPSPCSRQLDDDNTHESSDQQQYSPMEDECLARLLLDRLCLEQQFTPSPFFTQLKSSATGISNSVEARRRSLDVFEKVFFNQQLNLLELSTKDQSALMQDTHHCLSQPQAQFLYNVIKEMQTPECTAGITWVYDDYSLDGNTIMAIERLTELDSRLARVLCLLDIASHHPMFARKQDVIQRRGTQTSVDDDDDDDNSVIAVDLTGNSDHSLDEIILSSASDIVELDFDDETSIQSHSDVAQTHKVEDESDAKDGEHRSSDSSTSKQQKEDSCSIGFNTPPNVHAKDNRLIDNEEDEDTNYHCDNLTNRELNFFADAYGLESGMRKQTIALLNRIWKERAHQVGGDDDGDDEPRSADGSSKAVELIRHLKSRKDIWNKILRYECVDLDDFDGSSEDFTCDQIRKELDYHGFLKKSK